MKSGVGLGWVRDRSRGGKEVIVQLLSMRKLGVHDLSQRGKTREQAGIAGE